jgi:hypothetical protein
VVGAGYKMGLWDGGGMREGRKIKGGWMRWMDGARRDSCIIHTVYVLPAPTGSG